MSEQAVRRRWLRPRFTMGALLILILLCALPLGYVARVRSLNSARSDAWKRLVRKGVRFHLDVHGLPNSPIIEIELGWWAALMKETPTFRSIEVLETYSAAGQPAQIFIEDDDLRLLAHFPEMEKVSLTGVEHITDKGLGALRSLPKLQSFDANLLARIDGSFLEEWAKADTLEHLFLLNMAKLEGQKLAALENMTRLKSVTLNCCVYLDKTPLDAVNLPPQLMDLRILHTPINDEALARWLSQTMLRTLVLDTAFSRKIASQLRQQTQLSYFNITNAPLLDEDLMFLGRCPALYNLSIVGAPIEGKFLQRFPTRTQLDFLTLRGAPLRDEYVAELKRLKKLVHIDLGWTPLSGEFLEGASWPAMTTLDLGGTQLSEEGKTNLAAMEMQTSGTVHFPANWSALDLRRCVASKSAVAAVLDARFESEAKSNGINVSGFDSPSTRIPEIDRCPAEAMVRVKALMERAQSGATP